MNDFEKNSHSSNGEITENSTENLINTFFDMLKLMKERILTVVLTVAVCAALALGVSLVTYKPIYKTSVTFSITP